MSVFVIHFFFCLELWYEFCLCSIGIVWQHCLVTRDSIILFCLFFATDLYYFSIIISFSISDNSVLKKYFKEVHTNDTSINLFHQKASLKYQGATDKTHQCLFSCCFIRKCVTVIRDQFCTCRKATVLSNVLKWQWFLCLMLLLVHHG